MPSRPPSLRQRTCDLQRQSCRVALTESVVQGMTEALSATLGDGDQRCRHESTRYRIVTSRAIRCTVQDLNLDALASGDVPIGFPALIEVRSAKLQGFGSRFEGHLGVRSPECGGHPGDPESSIAVGRACGLGTSELRPP